MGKVPYLLGIQPVPSVLPLPKIKGYFDSYSCLRLFGKYTRSQKSDAYDASGKTKLVSVERHEKNIDLMKGFEGVIS